MISNQTIIIKNISKSFGYLSVFKKLSFELKAGHCYLLKGNNGQGKSTLLKILASLYSPDEGSITWNTQNLNNCFQAYKKQLFLLSHELGLYENFSPLENIYFFTSLYQKKIDPGQVMSVLEDLRLHHFAKTAIKIFSQGMKKKILLALMILIDPKILLLDEPYSDLDQAGIKFLNNSLSNFINQKNCLILITSHQIEVLGNLVSTTLVLKQQKITFLTK